MFFDILAHLTRIFSNPLKLFTMKGYLITLVIVVVGVIVANKVQAKLFKTA